MRILVCGGRNFDDANTLNDQLKKLRPNEIIHGGAKGADDLAGQWARNNRVKETVYQADWSRYGRAAGPKRNAEMIRAKPDLVLAFPGGKDTEHIIKTARKAGVAIMTVETP